MRRYALFALIAMAGLTGCGQEGTILSSAPTSSPELTLPPATATPEATASPTPSASPEESATPTPIADDESPEPSTSLEGKSGIYGTVVHGPVCSKGESDCEGRPIKGVVVKARNEQREDVGSQTTGEDGKFRIALEPGTYRVLVSTRSFSRCDQQNVDVQERFYHPVHITCDAGEPGS